MTKLPQKSIKYIGYYFDPKLGLASRFYSPAATTKMDYICNVIVRCGYEVELISPCKPSAPGFVSSQLIDINPQVRLNLLMSLGQGGRIRGILDFFLGNILIFFHLIFNTRRNEVVMVYHSLGYAGFINFAKRIRGFKLLLEAEEIYQDVVDCHDWQRRFENESFKEADGFIVPTRLLDEALNKAHKPVLVVHGTYMIHDGTSDDASVEWVDVVYAGTFDAAKGGVYSSINSARFLPSNYRIHILGFGSEGEVEKVIDLIQVVNSCSAASVVFHGLLTGVDYDKFISNCSIGLSTQSPSGVYNSTSFPSKILSYMAHGLQVVSIRIEAVETSDVGRYIHFYDVDDPRMIADAIIHVDLKSAYDPRKVVSDLDSVVVEAMPSLLASVTHSSH